MTVKFDTYVNFCVTAPSVRAFAAPAIAEGVFVRGRRADAVSRPSDTSAFALVSPLINFGCLISTQEESAEVCGPGVQQQPGETGAPMPKMTSRERRAGGVMAGQDPDLGHAPGAARPLISAR